MKTVPSLSLLHAVPIPIVVVDRHEHVVALNPMAIELLGDDTIGRHVVTVIRQPSVLEALGRCLSTGASTETRFSTRDHVHETLYKVACSPVTGQDPLAAIISFQDVTSQETAGQMRRDFVANVSHELRTPLTTIQGFIETLQGPANGDPVATNRFLSTMATEAERMIRLVADLLSLSQVEGDERMRPKERVEIHQVLNRVVEALDQIAIQHDVEVSIVPADQEYWFRGDDDQMVQVFTNLTENAIKYASEGKRVELSVGFTQRDPVLGQGAIRIDVKDFGQGFDEMHIHRLTERFYRVDSHRSRSLGGTGLGLAIVKHIVNRHKGRLKISSQLGEGSCFTVIIPDG